MTPTFWKLLGKLRYGYCLKPLDPTEQRLFFAATDQHLLTTLLTLFLFKLGYLLPSGSDDDFIDISTSYNILSLSFSKASPFRTIFNNFLLLNQSQCSIIFTPTEKLGLI